MWWRDGVALDNAMAAAMARAKESTTITWDPGTQARYFTAEGLDLPIRLPHP